MNAMSTMPATPDSTAAVVCASVSRPSALAKWLSVPAGKTASGRPRSWAIWATEATVPSPPATPRACGSPSISAPRSDDGSHSSTRASGSAVRIESAAPSLLPDAWLTITVRPFPRGRAGAVPAAISAGPHGFTGHSARPTTATVSPTAAPAQTSER